MSHVSLFVVLKNVEELKNRTFGSSLELQGRSCDVKRKCMTVTEKTYCYSSSAVWGAGFSVPPEGGDKDLMGEAT